MMRRLGRVLVALVLTSLAAIFILWLVAPNVLRGARERVTEAAVSAVEPWLAEQLRAIGNEALAGELSFESLELDLPVTVTLHDVLLRDGEMPVIECAQLVVALTEIPAPGRPVVIESIALESPVVHLTEQNGELVGFSPFLAPSDDVTEGEPAEDDAPAQRTSDAFAFRQLDVRNGTLRWEPESGHPMRLDQINLSLSGAPTDAPGRYAIDTVIERAPVATVAVRGTFDLDNVALVLDDSTVALDLEEAQYEMLPPSLQSVVRDYGIRGRLHAAVSGAIPLAEPRDDDAPRVLALDTTFSLEDANGRVGNWRFPVDRLDAAVGVTGRALTIDMLTIDAFDGSASIEGALGLRSAVPARLTGRIDGMRLERLLATELNDAPKYAGRFVADIELDGDLARLDERLAGSGTVKVTEGRLARLPVIGPLVEAVSGVFGGQPTDRADVSLTLQPGVVSLSSIDLVSSTVAARGAGTIGLDGALDLRLNAGPLEKVQSSLGAIGDVFGAITDALVKYHVTGTVNDAAVKVRPFGV